MTRAPVATRAAARASQRSCWRSTPPARRNRTTSDQAPTGMARTLTAKVTLARPSSRSAAGVVARGLTTGWYGTVKGCGAQATMATSAAAAVVQATRASEATVATQWG